MSAEQLKQPTTPYSGHPLLNERLSKLYIIKKNLLSLKKAERGNRLRETENKISIIKRWNQELQN